MLTDVTRPELAARRGRCAATGFSLLDAVRLTDADADEAGVRIRWLAVGGLSASHLDRDRASGRASR